MTDSITPNPTFYTAVIDWLEINFLFPIQRESLTHCALSTRVTLEELPRVTRVFSKVYNVLLDGVLIGQLSSEPFSTVIKDRNSCTFKLENHLCYTDSWVDIIKELADELGLQFQSLKKVDVALDGTGVVEPIRLAFEKKVRKVGRSSVQPIMNNGRKIDAFHIGKRTSDKFLRGYEKSREIEKSKKYYIRDFWERNGFMADKVERLEVSMKGKVVRDMGFKDDWDSLQDLTDPSYLVGLVRPMLKQSYEFTLWPDGAEKVTRLERVFTCIFECSCALLSKAKAIPSKKIRSVQTAIKTLYHVHLQTGRDLYKKIAEEMVENAGFEFWYLKRIPDWITERAREAGKGMEYIPCLEEYEPGLQLSLHRA